MTDRHLSTHGHDCLSEKPVASIKTLARYEPDTVYIGTGEYVAECVRADDGDYYLAADVDAAIEALQAEIERLAAQLTAAQQRPVEDGCHCGTCACNPNMTPAVRFDLSPAQTEGAIREHLTRLGWTPPDEAEALRAEVERWKGQHMRDSAELRRLCQHRDEYKARAERLAKALNAYQMGLRYAVRVWVLSDEIAWSEEEVDEAIESIISDAKREAGND